METADPPGNPAFPHLFAPITIGSAVIHNRILSSGHDTVMAENGLVTHRLAPEEAPHTGQAAGATSADTLVAARRS